MTLDRMKEIMDEQMRTNKSVLELMTKEERIELFETNSVADND